MRGPSGQLAMRDRACRRAPAFSSDLISRRPPPSFPLASPATYRALQCQAGRSDARRRVAVQLSSAFTCQAWHAVLISGASSSGRPRRVRLLRTSTRMFNVVEDSLKTLLSFVSSLAMLLWPLLADVSPSWPPVIGFRSSASVSKKGPSS